MPKRLFAKHQLTKVGDLVVELKNNEKSKYAGRTIESIRSFLSQTMNGERKLPDDLRQSIILCFEKFDPALDRDLFEKELQSAFDEAYEHRQEEKQKDGKIDNIFYNVQVAQDDYDRLVKKTEKAKTVCVFTAEPAEIKNNSKADKLKEELLKKVGIIEATNIDSANYTFYLAKSDTGYSLPINFWAGLYSYAKKLNISDVKEKLLKINKGENASLKVFVVPDDEIGITHGILDEGTHLQIGFITIYNNVPFTQDEEISVSRLEGRTLERVLTRLNKLRTSFEELEEFTFEKALEIISQ